MEKNRKNLRDFSIIILALVALSLIRSIVTVCINGFPQPTNIPEGMTKEIAKVITIITFALSFVLLLPQIYLGVKGIKIANGSSTSGKAHIIWALILIVFSAITVISSISDLTKAFNLDSVLNLLGPVVDLALFAFYYIYARKVANDK